MTAYDPALVEAMTNYIRDIRTGAPPWSRKRETPTESDRVLGVTAMDVLAHHGVDLTENRTGLGPQAATLKAFVRDLATHGIRFDLNPTLDSRDPLATDRYVGRIDADIRKRAIQALGLAAEAGITVDAHTEES